MCENLPYPVYKFMMFQLIHFPFEFNNKKKQRMPTRNAAHDDGHCWRARARVYEQRQSAIDVI